MSSKFRGKYLQIIPLGIAHLKFLASGRWGSRGGRGRGGRGGGGRGVLFGVLFGGVGCFFCLFAVIWWLMFFSGFLLVGWVFFFLLSSGVIEAFFFFVICYFC